MIAPSSGSGADISVAISTMQRPDALGLSKGTVSKHMAVLAKQAFVIVGSDCIRITDDGEAAVITLFGWPAIENAPHVLRSPI